MRSMITNTDRVFLGFQDGVTATTASSMPLEPGEMIFIGTFFPSIMSPEWNSGISVVANSGIQDIRGVEFSG